METSDAALNEDTKIDEIIKLDKRFGRIAIKNKLLSVEQVKDALRKQDYIYKKSNYIVLIGDLLVDSGALKERYRDAILKRQNRLISDDKKHKSFGSIAVSKGYITEEQLNAALKLQAEKYKEKRNVVFLGDVLVDQGLLTSEQRDDVVKKREQYRSSKNDIAQMSHLPINEGEQQDSENKTMPAHEPVDQLQQESSENKSTSALESVKQESPENKSIPAHESVDQLQQESPENKAMPAQESEDDSEEDDESGTLQTDLNLEENLKIVFSEDNLEAYLTVNAMLPVRTRLIDLKHFIQSSGINHGLVDNSTLKKWMQNKKMRRRPMLIAQGTQPVPPKDARMVFHFEINPNKAGTEKKDGSMDYKNRGEIISVKEGTLLAEKIPVEEGKPGLDVTGKIINVQKPKDIVIKTGKGVHKSPDNLQIIASVNGMPEIDRSGKISVLQVLVINGDVGMQTGHIFFDGIVSVRGEISPGFQVKAEKLEASAIMNGVVTTTGDVLVKGGIVGAKIQANGEVHAKFLKAAQIISRQDLVVQKEIVDCMLNIGGKCLCESGKIVASQISASRGVKAAEIGSEYSSSCQIMVGVSSKIQKQLKRLHNTLKHCKKDEQADVKTEISRIKARELSGIPDQTADIIASKGIIGAEIQTRGKIVTGFLKNAVIESLGHVVVQKEILKTKIQCGGEVNVKNGKVLLSNIISLCGITANSVGSEISAPCKLSFGVNEAVKDRLENYRNSLELKSKDLEQSKELLENYIKKFKNFETDAQDISWIKQYTKKISGPMRLKLDQLEQIPPESRMLKIKEYIGTMDAKMKASDYTKEFRNLRQIQEYMEKYFGRHQKMHDQITHVENKVKDLKSEIKTLQSDIKALAGTAATNPGAKIHILGRIFSRTDLKGPGSALLLTQDLGPCTIAEERSKIVIQKTGGAPLKSKGTVKPKKK